jgi:hypothetical protein
MAPVFLLALLLGVLGVGMLFLFPWVGGPLLLIAIVLGIAGLVWGGAVAASDESVDPATRDVEAPHMPGPD